MRWFSTTGKLFGGKKGDQEKIRKGPYIPWGGEEVNTGATNAWKWESNSHEGG